MINAILSKLLDGKNLEKDEMTYCMDQIMTGQVSEVQTAAFLTALKAKGETIEEITAAAKVMRDKASKVALEDADVLDTCGTGGDGMNTFNVSTAVAIVAASVGIRVLKHGNRSASSKCGSADVLEELGVNISQTPEHVKACVEQTNMGFMFAQVYHQSMKHVASTRKQLGFRTLFNILGPLSNPAGAKRQVLGVSHPKLAPVMAAVLGELGVKHAYVVHGEDGLDEISLTGATNVVELKDGKLGAYTIQPEQFGLNRCSMADLTGGDRQINARIILDLLQGAKGPKRDMLLLNSGAAIYVGGKAGDLAQGIQMAEEAIDSGKAIHTLNRFIEVSQSAIPA